MKKLSELSIFFPFWNEEKNISQIIMNAVEVMPTVAEKFEILIIDDGSKDKTLSIAEDLVAKYPFIRIISHNTNRGYGAAIKSGLENAKYNYIVFTDGDLQFDLHEVSKFVDCIEKADMVIGYRRRRKDKKIVKRLLLMNLLKIWDFVLFGFHFKDIDCGFKMFTRHSLEVIGPLRSEGAMITTEILAKAKKKRLKIIQVGVEHFPRVYGEQTGANIFVVVRAVLESLTLFMDIKNRRF